MPVLKPADLPVLEPAEPATVAGERPDFPDSLSRMFLFRATHLIDKFFRNKQ